MAVAQVKLLDVAAERFKTVHWSGLLDTTTCNRAFARLLGELTWIDGVRSLKYADAYKQALPGLAPGATRKAAPLNIGKQQVADVSKLTDNECVDSLLAQVFSLMCSTQPSNTKTRVTLTNYRVCHIYCNLYRNGMDFVPGHSHQTCQLVISLGATRQLKVGSKSYNMCNGDVAVFGHSPHGVPVEPNVTGARISIAVFLEPICKLPAKEPAKASVDNLQAKEPANTYGSATTMQTSPGSDEVWLSFSSS